jgi:hypothetical protein
MDEKEDRRPNVDEIEAKIKAANLIEPVDWADKLQPADWMFKYDYPFDPASGPEPYRLPIGMKQDDVPIVSYATGRPQTVGHGSVEVTEEGVEITARFNPDTGNPVLRYLTDGTCRSLSIAVRTDDVSVYDDALVSPAEDYRRTPFPLLRGFSENTPRLIKKAVPRSIGVHSPGQFSGHLTPTGKFVPDDEDQEDLEVGNYDVRVTDSHDDPALD